MLIFCIIFPILTFYIINLQHLFIKNKVHLPSILIHRFTNNNYILYTNEIIQFSDAIFFDNDPPELVN